MWCGGHIMSCFLGNGVNPVAPPRRQYVGFVFGLWDEFGADTSATLRSRLRKVSAAELPLA
jgi:hypothetical protein